MTLEGGGRDSADVGKWGEEVGNVHAPPTRDEIRVHHVEL